MPRHHLRASAALDRRADAHAPGGQAVHRRRDDWRSMPHNQCLPAQLDEDMGFKLPVQLRQNTKQQGGEFLVPIVAGGHDQKPCGSAAQEMTTDEIRILAKDNSLIAVGNGGNHAVGAAIAIR